MEAVEPDATPLKWWHVGLILLGALLVRLIFLVGMTGSDDLQYADQARRMAGGSFDAGGYFANTRVGIIAPTALAYKLFGITTATTVWFTMFSSLLGVLAVVLLGWELFGARAGMWAGALYAVFPIDVVEAGLLLPDICVAAFATLALFCVLRGERALSIFARIMLFLLAGLLVGAGYLCKMTAILPILILVGYLLIRRKPVWVLPLLAGLAAVVALEGMFYQSTAGDFLLRFHLEAGWNHAAADARMSGQLASLYEYPRAMFISIEEFGIFWYLFLAAVIWAESSRLRRAWVVVLWVVPLWLLLEFGVANYRQLTFAAHVPRYLVLVTIPAAALIGAMFAHLHGRRHWVWLSVLSAITLASSLFFAGLHAALAESTSWNSRQVATRLKDLPHRPTFVLLGRPVVEWCTLPDKLDVRSLYRKHDPQTGADTEPLPLADLSGSYVVVDNRLITFAQQRQDLRLPDYLVAVPKSWTIAAEVRNDFSGLKYLPIRTVRWALDSHLLPGPLASRFSATLGTIMEHNDCVIYSVPSATGGPGS